MNKELQLPPVWCATICRNAYNEKCIEQCALKRDCSGFELKRGINLIDLAPFPIEEVNKMTRGEKFVSVVVYVAKITDHLKGVTEDAEFKFAGRRNNDTKRRSPLPTHLSFKDILPIVQETVSSSEVGKVSQDQED